MKTSRVCFLQRDAGFLSVARLDPVLRRLWTGAQWSQPLPQAAGSKLSGRGYITILVICAISPEGGNSDLCHQGPGGGGPHEPCAQPGPPHLQATLGEVSFRYQFGLLTFCFSQDDNHLS